MKLTKKWIAAAVILSAIATSLVAQTNFSGLSEPDKTDNTLSIPRTNRAESESKDAVTQMPDTKRVHAKATPHSPPFLEIRGESNLVPVVAIIMVFGSPVAFVAIFCYFRNRKTKMLHETIRAMVEKGVPIPPELFAAQESVRFFPPGGSSAIPRTANRARNDFRVGLILIAVGAGIGVLSGKSGLIILFIGVALVIASFFERRKDSNEKTN
jgi:hypothetical protein